MAVFNIPNDNTTSSTKSHYLGSQSFCKIKINGQWRPDITSIKWNLQRNGSGNYLMWDSYMGGTKVEPNPYPAGTYIPDDYMGTREVMSGGQIGLEKKVQLIRSYYPDESDYFDETNLRDDTNTSIERGAVYSSGRYQYRFGINVGACNGYKDLLPSDYPTYYVSPELARMFGITSGTKKFTERYSYRLVSPPYYMRGCPTEGDFNWNTTISNTDGTWGGLRNVAGDSLTFRPKDVWGYACVNRPLSTSPTGYNSWYSATTLGSSVQYQICVRMTTADWGYPASVAIAEANRVGIRYTISGGGVRNSTGGTSGTLRNFALYDTSSWNYTSPNDGFYMYATEGLQKVGTGTSTIALDNSQFLSGNRHAGYQTFTINP